MSHPVEVVVFGGSSEWHGRRLRQAFEARGARIGFLSLAACGFALDGGIADLHLPGLQRLPDAALVRFIAAGSFEQVTLRLGVLHGLAALGVPVVNSARAIERCVDKSMTSFLLARAGVPTPPSWAIESREQAHAAVLTEGACGHRLVLKPLFGAQGRGLRLVRTLDDLPPAEEVAGVYYLQRYIGAEGGWSDFRVFVVAGEPVAAMRRSGQGWITNLRRGAAAHPQPPVGALADIAVAACRAVGAHHAGVDVMRDAEGGLQVLEVNSMPAWKGLQGVSAADIAGSLAAATLATVGTATHAENRGA